VAEPKLTEEELAAIERLAESGNVASRMGAAAQALRRLLAEVRTLRGLLEEVEPYVSVARTPPELVQRLRDEVRRD
jgi:hypothetical protein